MKKGEKSPTKTNEPEKNIPNDMASDSKYKVLIEDLAVAYNGKKAIKNINMKIPDKAVTALIGPSGCGKTTLLRTINRMHDLTKGAEVSGKIIIDGENVYDASINPILQRRKIGMVFQKPNPFPTMSIWDNVAAGLKLNGVKDKNILNEIIEDSLKMAYLWEEVKDELKKPAVALSGGQQQRLCIARALAIQPEVLLMDEPASALDPIASQKIEQTIIELKKHYTIIIVTHNMQQALRVSDRTGFMYLGDLVEYDKTEKIFKNPEKELTANYVQGRFG
ncbi:MAG: phosphate ABC transporter ATP-binding protein [Nitrosopumilus sp.]|nr:MAG: phosphate ABC transporter ATP-binding protein [Nitrosopumilus sp.]